MNEDGSVEFAEPVFFDVKASYEQDVSGYLQPQQLYVTKKTSVLLSLAS